MPKIDQHKKSLFSSLKKKKSNAQLLEAYLARCMSARIGTCSLFRDFLSVQRDEDRVISKQIVCQLVAQHQLVTPHHLKRKRASTTTDYNHHQQKKLMLAESSLPPSPPSSISITEFPEYRHDSGLSCSIKQDDCSMDDYHDTIHNYQLIKVLGKGATGKVKTTTVLPLFVY